MSLKIKILLSLLLFSTLQAEWGTISLKEHINKSSLIVIAEFESEMERNTTDFGITQFVSFKPIENIKGDTNSSFVVKGQSLEVCMPQMLFSATTKGRYLLFLYQENNATKYYDLTHGESSGLLIKHDTIDWIIDDSRIDFGEREKRLLDDVVKIIYTYSSNKLY